MPNYSCASPQCLPDKLLACLGLGRGRVGIESPEHVFRVPFDCHFRENLSYDTVLSDDKSCALEAHDLFPVHGLFFVNAISLSHFFFCVGKQRHVQIELFPEFRLGLGIVGADAYHNRTSLLDFLAGVAEPASLADSAGRVGLGEKEQHNTLFAGVLAETHCPSTIVGQ